MLIAGSYDGPGFLRHAHLRRAYAGKAGDRAVSRASWLSPSPTGPADVDWSWPRPRSSARHSNSGFLFFSPTRSRTTQSSARSSSASRQTAIIVVGYGRIIPQWMIDLPRSATSTCTLRCCRSIAEPRRFSGRLRGRIRDWRDYHADRRWPGYRRHPGAARRTDSRPMTPR